MDEVWRGLLHNHTVWSPLLLSPWLLRWELPRLGTVELAGGISLRRHPELGRHHTALATNNRISLGNGHLGILRLPGFARLLGHGTTHHGLALEILHPRLLFLGGRDRARGRSSTLRGFLGWRLLGSWLRTWLNESHLARRPLQGGPRSPESLLGRCLGLNSRAGMLCLQRSRSCGALRNHASLIRSRGGCSRVGRRSALHSRLALWSLSSWRTSRGLLAGELVEVGGVRA